MLWGCKAYILKEKLKMLRVRLRWRNKEVFGWVDLKVVDIMEKLNKINNIASGEGGRLRREESNRVWECVHYRESMLS